MVPLVLSTYRTEIACPGRLGGLPGAEGVMVAPDRRSSAYGLPRRLLGQPRNPESPQTPGKAPSWPVRALPYPGYRSRRERPSPWT